MEAILVEHHCLIIQYLQMLKSANVKQTESEITPLTVMHCH